MNQPHSIEDISDALEHLTPDELDELENLLQFEREVWYPLPGPQTDAYLSEADVIGYGGAAGGGKTDLAVGKCLTQHVKAAVFRREGTELTAIVDRFEEIIGDRNTYSGKDKIWRLKKHTAFRCNQLEFGSTPNPGDETKHQGRPKDLLVLDEAANFLESQARFLMGWVRTVNAGQRCQTLMTFNPPTSAEGRWIVSYFGPWLDKRYPGKRAEPGELRWFATINGEDKEVADGTPFYIGDELITPQSRTFIPSRISDNPYLMGTGYMATLQSMPEPLRSQMLYGDFSAGMEDDPWQIIPTSWVEIAMERWKERDRKGPMDSMGVDVARGGRDNSVISRRHGMWFDELVTIKGSDTPEGSVTAGQVVAHRRSKAPVHVDLIGWGSEVYAHLKDTNVQVLGINVGEGTGEVSQEGGLKFANVRTMLIWRMREALNPENDTGIALPPDNRLLADLTAPLWSLRAGKIAAETKDEIYKRLKRSTDFGDTVCLALIETPREDFMSVSAADNVRTGYDPYE